MKAPDRSRGADPFERLIWEDKLTIGDVEFAFPPEFNTRTSEPSPDALVLWKPRSLIEFYRNTFSKRAFRPRQILELGIWKGGSVALWFELFQPCKIVAVDIAPQCEDEAFSKYLRERGAGQWLKPYWGVDQADSERLREIVEREFDEPLDLVIDDASHLYGPTKASFETLFPSLRPQGLYCIEDWNWECGPDGGVRLGGPDQSPARLIAELIRAVGTLANGIANLTIRHAFAVVARGGVNLDPDDFTLAGSIVNRFDAGNGAMTTGSS